MTEAAGELRRPDGRRGARRGRRGARAGGPDRQAASPTRTRCRSRTAPGERIEPLISLQWFCAWTSWRAPAIEAVRVRAASGSTPSAGRGSTSTGSRTSGRGASRASSGGGTGCRSGTATRARRPTSARSRPSAAAPATASCAATRTCSTPGSPRRCGRSRRSAGRSDTPELRAFYPTDVLVTARDIIFLWVARMVMMGLEFAGRRPVRRRLHHVDHPGARRAPDVEVARHRHRPARRDRRARRRRGALRPAGDVVVPGRALLGREDPAGPAARQQDVERVAAGAD